MCFLALVYRGATDAPVIVGANREEVYDRGGEPPRVLDGPVPAVGGVDPKAGGTWLAVNAYGVLIALTNRPKSDVPAAPRSRGLLVRDLLDSPSAAEAIEKAGQEVVRHPYDGFNLLCADRDNAMVLHAADWLRIRMLPPGVHVLTNRDVNEMTDVRVAYARHWLRGAPNDSGELVKALQTLCGKGGWDGPAICIHKRDRGTVSSSVVAVREPLTKSTYLHAQGSPDRTPYEDYSRLFRELPEPSPRSGGRDMA
jgi:Transport and Golgi organisation 2